MEREQVTTQHLKDRGGVEGSTNPSDHILQRLCNLLKNNQLSVL